MWLLCLSHQDFKNLYHNSDTQLNCFPGQALCVLRHITCTIPFKVVENNFIRQILFFCTLWKMDMERVLVHLVQAKELVNGRARIPSGFRAHPQACILLPEFSLGIIICLKMGETSHLSWYSFDFHQKN